MVTYKTLIGWVRETVLCVLTLSFLLMTILLFVDAAFFGNHGLFDTFVSWYIHHWFFPIVYFMVYGFIVILISQFKGR